MSELPVWATQNNSDYLQERVRRYNEAPSDDLLYRMGSCMDTFINDDEKLLRHTGYCLTPEQRYRVLNQLLCNGFKIECDLALLIFGRQQLEEWLQRSQQAYPRFDFHLCFEYQKKFKSGFDDGINFAMYWHPQPGAPVPLSEEETDFPWRPFWDCGDMFWGERPGGFTNDFDFTLYCYPDSSGFTKPGWICEEGDWYTMKDERDVDLMTVAQVLQHFAVPA